MFHPKETEWSIINNRPFPNCIISKRESLRYCCYEAATAAFVQKVADAKNDPEGGKIMGIFEYLDSKIPDYYPTMYRDGYTPEQIMYAAHRKLRKECEAREAAKREAAEANEIPEVKITSKVVIKK